MTPQRSLSRLWQRNNIDGESPVRIRSDRAFCIGLYVEGEKQGRAI